ncbi:MAG: hypothetical protein LBM08_13040 [Dysgonamonadaceae bacterium]|jgi:hypothetical protein|nr:hypothetical protein [Dysgonamonadaceae bacterium]
MKKVLLLLMMSVPAIATLHAQDTTIRSQGSENFKRIFVEAGFGAYVPDEACFQVMWGIGYYLSPNNRLSLDFGAGFNSKEIGSFSYTIDGSTEQFNDGVIKRSYTFMPILLSWGHEFGLSEKLKLRLGPSIGINRISASTTYTAESHNVSNFKNKPDIPSDSESTFAGAATIALEWRLFEASGIAFAYKILANEAIDLELVKLNGVSHQIGVTYWLKF